jgi:type IV secretory pathway VirB2 component (pilin)
MFILTIYNLSCAIDIVPDQYSPSSSLPTSSTTATTKLGYIITALRYIGSGVSVIIFIIIGIQYILGSIEDKAQFKEKMMPYIVGAIFVFAASNIATILYNISRNIM